MENNTAIQTAIAKANLIGPVSDSALNTVTNMVESGIELNSMYLGFLDDGEIHVDGYAMEDQTALIRFLDDCEQTFDGYDDDTYETADGIQIIVDWCGEDI